MRNVASSIGISLVIAQLTQGTRYSYAVLSQHINPFNHAMQMPDVRGMLDMTTSQGRGLANLLLTTQAQIIAFAKDYQMVMIFTACAIPLAIMIGSTKAALRKQAAGPEHAVIE
jgi:DHA2 family multidrug resistance protein